MCAGRTSRDYPLDGGGGAHAVMSALWRRNGNAGPWKNGNWPQGRAKGVRNVRVVGWQCGERVSQVLQALLSRENTSATNGVAHFSKDNANAAAGKGVSVVYQEASVAMI